MIFPIKKFKNAIIGGTFDNLHAGHKYFILNSFRKSHKVTIGLTSENFSQNKISPSNIRSFEDRKKDIIKFLHDKNLAKKATIIPIDDIFGITLEDKNLDAIFVTNETFDNAIKINEEREKIGFPKLKIVKIKMLEDELGKKISSTQIRSGTINDFGTYYTSFFNKKDEYILIDKHRDEFKKPIGILERKFKVEKLRNKFIIAVGDMVVYELIQRGIVPNVSIYDMLTKREQISDEILKGLPKSNIVLKNRPGAINSTTAIAIQKLIQNAFAKSSKIAIRIVGEEDLLTIPAILFAPINAVVIYGQRDMGAVLVDTTLEKKKEIEEFYLSKFN